jgi:hypothetical protein
LQVLGFRGYDLRASHAAPVKQRMFARCIDSMGSSICLEVSVNVLNWTSFYILRHSVSV